MNITYAPTFEVVQAAERIPFYSSYDFWQIIATLILGFGALFFAYMQVRIRREAIMRDIEMRERTLRLELYDRRYEVYHAMKIFLSKIEVEADMKIEDWQDFVRATAHARFLFDEELSAYIDRIRSVAFNMRKFNKIYTAARIDGVKLDKLIDENHDDSVWVGEQLDKLVDVYSPYLRFGKNLK